MDGPGGFVTTHVLDTSRGQPAAGIAIDIYRLEGAGGRRRLGSAIHWGGRAQCFPGRH